MTEKPRQLGGADPVPPGSDWVDPELGARESCGNDDEAFDAIAELFLGTAGADDPGPARPERGPSPEPPTADLDAPPLPRLRTHLDTDPARQQIECLILGHLPVLASAWVGQYARHVASSLGGPVALVKLYAGYISLELVGTDPMEAGPTTSPGGPVSLPEAIAHARRQTDHWIIRVDDMAEPALAEAALNPNIDAPTRLTLLTGADDAAAVACYRTIKSLVHPESVSQADNPRLGLALMGAVPEQAERTACRILRAVSMFLHRRVDLSICPARISASPSRTLYRGPTPSGPQELIAMIQSAEPSRVPERSEPIPGGEAIASDADDDAPRDSAVDEQRSHDEALGSVPVPGPALEPPPLRLVEPILSDPDPADEPDTDEPPSLSRLVPGLSRLPIRCPFARGIEIALDETGRLHLLVRIDQEASASSEDEGLGRLLAASSWCRPNARLIARAIDKPARPRSSPVLHLFTPAPRRVRRLLDVRNLRLHHLAAADVDGRTAWVCAPLN